MNPESTQGDAAYRIVGHGCVIAGLASIAAMPITGRIDFGFVLWFWLGGALLERGVWARRIAILLSAAFLGGSLWVFVMSLAGSAEGAEALRAKNPAPDLAAVDLGLTLTLVLPGLVLLLGPDARRLAGVSPGFRPKPKLILWYVIGTGFLVSGVASFPRMIKTERVSVSSASRLQGAGDLRAWAVEATRVDGAAPPRVHLETWILVLQRHLRYSGGEDAVTEVAGHRFKSDAPRSWMFFPPVPPPTSNIFIIAEDGRLIPVPRRITPASLKAVEVAAIGFKDVEDLERRLLSALPE